VVAQQFDLPQTIMSKNVVLPRNFSQRGVTNGRPCLPLAFWNRHHNTRHQKESIMGKYFLAWIMGVPAIVLVLIYLFFH